MFVRLSAVQPSVPVVVKRSVISQLDLEPIPDTIEAEDNRTIEREALQ
mgnify:CR=1 FL=1